MEPGRETVEVQAYRKLLTASTEHFNILRSAPAFSHDEHWDTQYQKAFKSFAKLWRFQQEHRAALTDAGLRRWEIGEIASRVGQLYYAFYLRTGEGWYLSESHAFFDAASARDYFAECHQTPALAQKRLRHRARHIVTCLLLDKPEEARGVVEAWRRDVDDYAADHRPVDAAEWRALTDDAAAFVEASANAMRARGGSRSSGDRCRVARRSETRGSPDGKKASQAAEARFKKRRRLGGVVLCGAYPSQVRFGDWTLDAFRVHRACEWEDATRRRGADGGAGTSGTGGGGVGLGSATPSGSVASSPKGPPPTHQKSSRSRTISVGSAGSGFESSAPGSSSVADEPRGPDGDDASDAGDAAEDEIEARRTTPRKYAVRAGSARQFLLAAATACEELDRNETLLLYLSARGGDRAVGAEGLPHAGACPGVRLGTTAAAAGRASGAAGHFASLSVGGEVSLDGFPSRRVETGDAARGGWAAAAAAPSAADARSAAAKASQAGSDGSTGRRRAGSARGEALFSRDPDLALYPTDLAPLTRRRLFVVVDAEAARQFHLMSSRGPCGPTPGGETPVVLAAAPSAPPRAPLESRNGRFFTLFLTNPAAGARALCGLGGPDSGERESASAALESSDSREASLRAALERVAGALLEAEAADALDPAWSDAVGDPFLRRFAAHFVLCRALVAAHATTKAETHDEESGAPSRFAPTCSPPLPASCDARACALHAAAFAEALGLEREFHFA